MSSYGRLYGPEDVDYVRTEISTPPKPQHLQQQESSHRGYGIGQRLLKSAGWTEGSALGARGDGLVVPIQVDEKFNMSGLGYTSAARTQVGSMNGLHTKPNRTPELRDILRQPIEYLECSEIFNNDFDYQSGLSVGPKQEINYNIYCDADKVDKLFKTKDLLDDVDNRQFLAARRRANPYETIGKSIFINRAAVKLANLNYECRLIPSNTDEMFYFCDVCAGPGGFTEYLLWYRRGKHGDDSNTYGWGMTLAGKDDWTLHKFREDTNVFQRFKTIYGPDQTGNVYKEDNLREFQKVVLEGTQHLGVHLFTADGGFSVAGNENYQEEEVKRLVLCQFLCMFTVLRKGGTFVCKIFDVFTPFTAGLFYILYKHFTQVAIVKPITSRPANSERYVVCKDLLEFQPKVIEYLFAVNRKFDELDPSISEDVLHTVDQNLMLKDTKFMSYLRKSNLMFIDEQIEGLSELVLYLEDLQLEPFADQEKIKIEASNLWSVEPEPRRQYQPFQQRGRGRGRGGYDRGGRDHRDYRNQPYQRNYDNHNNNYRRDDRNYPPRGDRDNHYRNQQSRDYPPRDRDGGNYRRDYQDGHSPRDYPPRDYPPRDSMQTDRNRNYAPGQSQSANDSPSVPRGVRPPKREQKPQEEFKFDPSVLNAYKA